MVDARKRRSFFGIPSMVMNFAGEAQAPASRGAIGARQHRAKGLPLPGSQVPARPRGGLGGPPKRKGRGWDALKVLGGTLMDLDGSMGYGHMDRAAQGIQARNAMMAEQAEQRRRQAMIQKYTDGLSPEMAQLAQLAPDKFLESRMQQAFAQPAQSGRFLTPEEEIAMFGSDHPGTFYQEPGKAPKLIEGSFEKSDGQDWQRTTIMQNGVPTIVEYDRNAPNPQETIRPIGAEPTDAGDSGPDASAEGVLRREFNSLTEDFRDVHQAYNRITATDTATPAGQMGLIFQYMKMLDPGSTVREGEYATAQNTTGVPGQVLNVYNQMLEGKFLTPTQIRDFEQQAGNLYRRAEQIYSGQVQQYQQLSQSYEFNPSRTVMDVRSGFSAAPTQAAPQFPNAPQIGTVEDGHRYIGGDPAQPASWEPVG
jgi:hypothetical protein